jgi:pSer/pThr/pTyr-binding forkhead associated (FHA) protein
VFTLGRDAEADIVLVDADVSRLHASLSVEVDRARLRDLESKNGVCVDGRDLAGGAELELRDASRIELGNVVLELSHPGLRVRGALSAGGQATFTRKIEVSRDEAEPNPRVPMAAALFFGMVILLLLLLGP